MKDVITVDELLGRIFAYCIDWQEFKDTSEHDHDVSTFAGKIKAEMKDELKSQFHSLLISKLPEKKDAKAPYDILELEKAFQNGRGSAIDDMRKSIDELFEVNHE